MLVAEHIVKRFHGQTALAGASIEIQSGQCIGLIGPNGSGKSTLLNVISGFETPDSGTVSFEGKRVQGIQPWHSAQIGLRRTFQLPNMPQLMTVLEVMLTGYQLPLGATAWASVFRPGRVTAEQRVAIAQARQLLSEINLLSLEHHAAGTLSGGQQKLLSLGTALIGRPRILLLDEPTAGVHPALREKLVEILHSAREKGTSLLIVEHDMGFVRDMCESVYVLDKGRIVTFCKPFDLEHDQRVVDAYLGEGASLEPTKAVEKERLGAPV